MNFSQPLNLSNGEIRPQHLTDVFNINYVGAGNKKVKKTTVNKPEFRSFNMNLDPRILIMRKPILN